VKRHLTDMEAFRAEELLMQRATEGLSDIEARELAALGVDDDLSFDLAASGVDLATLQIEQMPAHVADKVLAASGVTGSDTTLMPSMMPMTLAGVVPPRPIGSAPRPAAPQPHPAPVIPLESRRKRSAGTVAMMIAAAASIVLGVGASVWQFTRPAKIVEREKLVEVTPPAPKPPTPAEGRAALLANANDATTLAWTATKDPNAAGATGDVVWSASAQRGYMRFKGLAVNDAKQLQYQLWIFDKDRDQAFPVDGGVFDVSSTGEVIVPISAKLHVDEPVLFAVTVEAPGGVVVSKRERIVVTAAPPKTG
jgi:hypothetical protein